MKFIIPKSYFSLGSILLDTFAIIAFLTLIHIFGALFLIDWANKKVTSKNGYFLSWLWMGQTAVLSWIYISFFFEQAAFGIETTTQYFGQIGFFIIFGLCSPFYLLYIGFIQSISQGIFFFIFFFIYGFSTLFFAAWVHLIMFKKTDLDEKTISSKDESSSGVPKGHT